MKNSEIRKLKMQLVLVGGLFVFCIATAIVIVNNRPFFEKYLLEKYKPLPTNLIPLAQKMEKTGEVPEVFGRLTEKQQGAFYEHWMTLAEVEKDTPKMLVSVAPSLHIARVEQTLVCGSQEQRTRALRFVELGFVELGFESALVQSGSGVSTNNSEVLSMLGRIDGWATRRRLSSFRTEVDETIVALKQ
ncbi:MAG: hypothetical protein CMJ64_19165 [Planctomycetaceae bacterium]|nr:hypothetical protein [Planctomycetaceae bacterium]